MEEQARILLQHPVTIQRPGEGHAVGLPDMRNVEHREVQAVRNALLIRLNPDIQQRVVAEAESRRNCIRIRRIDKLHQIDPRVDRHDEFAVEDNRVFQNAAVPLKMEGAVNCRAAEGFQAAGNQLTAACNGEIAG